jgi:hypothetical protein
VKGVPGTGVHVLSGWQTADRTRFGRSDCDKEGGTSGGALVTVAMVGRRYYLYKLIGDFEVDATTAASRGPVNRHKRAPPVVEAAPPRGSDGHRD